MSKKQLEAIRKVLEGLAADEASYYDKDDALGYVLNTDRYFAGMSSARDKEKAEAQTLRQQIAEINEKYKGVDPEMAKKLIDEAKKAADQLKIDAGKIDEVVEERVNNRVTAMKTDLEGRLTTAEKRALDAENRLSVVVIDRGIQVAAIKANVVPEAVEDATYRARNIYKLVNGDATPLDPKGEVIYGKDGKTPMTMDEWFESMKVIAPHWFRQAKGSGGEGGARTPDGTPVIPQGLQGVELLKAARRGK